jgi:hypothetical protein
MMLDARRREELAAAVLSLGLVVAVFLMAGFRVSLPELHAVEAFRAVLGTIAGLGIIAGSLYLGAYGVRHARPFLVVLGAFLILIGLPLAGVTVGLPGFLVPLGNLLNALISFVALLLEAFS